MHGDVLGGSQMNRGTLLNPGPEPGPAAKMESLVWALRGHNSSIIIKAHTIRIPPGDETHFSLLGLFIICMDIWHLAYQSED